MRPRPFAAPIALLLCALASCGDDALPFAPVNTCDPDSTSCQGADDCFALCLCEEGTRESCEDECGVESDLDFDSIDGQPTHHLFLLVVPEHSGGQYLKALARISRFFRDAAFRQRLSEVETLEEVIGTIEEEDAKL